MARILVTALISSVITFAVVCSIFMNSNSIYIGERINFKSSEGDFYFDAVPSKGRDLEVMDRQFLSYKEKSGLSESAKMYRISRKNYLKISKWNSYKYGEEWNYPLR